ncbi:hypothetical protein COOONC_15223, partial [Cooperia oncophora]
MKTVLAFGGSQAPSDFVNGVSACDESIVRTLGHNIVYLAISRFKSRIGLLTPDPKKVDDVLDCIKVSDVVCFLWPTDGELSDEDRLLLTIIKAHG